MFQGRQSFGARIVTVTILHFHNQRISEVCQAFGPCLAAGEAFTESKPDISILKGLAAPWGPITQMNRVTQHSTATSSEFSRLKWTSMRLYWLAGVDPEVDRPKGKGKTKGLGPSTNVVLLLRISSVQSLLFRSVGVAVGTLYFSRLPCATNALHSRSSRSANLRVKRPTHHASGRNGLFHAPVEHAKLVRTLQTCCALLPRTKLVTQVLKPVTCHKHGKHK
jgi:hypothetical protein